MVKPRFTEGDTYSYLSSSSLTIVTWTRDKDGVWRCDDGRDYTVNDYEVRAAMEDDQ